MRRGLTALLAIAFLPAPALGLDDAQEFRVGRAADRPELFLSDRIIVVASGLQFGERQIVLHDHKSPRLTVIALDESRCESSRERI